MIQCFLEADGHHLLGFAWVSKAHVQQDLTILLLELLIVLIDEAPQKLAEAASLHDLHDLLHEHRVIILVA